MMGMVDRSKSRKDGGNGDLQAGNGKLTTSYGTGKSILGRGKRNKPNRC